MIQDDPPFGPGSAAPSADPPESPDRREAPRAVTIMRVGKLISDDGEELCRIKNISAGGIMAEAGSLRAIGEVVSVELKNDQQVTGKVVWTRGATLGIRFDQNVDVGEVLASRTSQKGRNSRAPRMEVPCLARLRVGAKYYGVQVRDISQGGIKIEIDDPYCVPGREAVITVQGLRSVEGIVRWCRGGTAGVAFKQMIPFDELTHWLGSRIAATSEEPRPPRLASAEPSSGWLTLSLFPELPIHLP
jgi:hypothetical protein